MLIAFAINLVSGVVVKRSLVHAFTLCAAVFAAETAAAQQYPAAGTPVRVQVDTGIVLGVVHRRTWDSLLVRPPSGLVLAYERGEIRNVSSYGPQYGRAAKRGAKIGGLIGAVALGAALVADYRMLKGTSECICIPWSFVVLPPALASPIVGAGVGALFAQPGWGAPRQY